MKPFLFIICLFLSFSVNALVLQSGDIVLISFNCYECRVIESETKSLFSHSGVVLVGENNEISVAEALTKVRLSPLQEFLKNRTPGTKAHIYRPYELEHRNNNFGLDKSMRNLFEKDFKGLPFDSKYFWNNFDEKGHELLYCSEFVAKFLDRFLSTPSITFPLTYQKNYDYWLKYFKGNVPEGEIGNSPASLSTDPRFHLVGTLN